MTAREFAENEYLDLATASDVLPFCVYHWINPNAGIYRGYISGPSIVKGDDGNFRYMCVHPNSLNPYGKWSLAFTFYAINPMVRPIPKGMALFCAQRKDSFSWDTPKIQFVYDPYDVSDDCLYFIAYTKPTPWTKALYIHIQGTLDFPRTAFPSWSPNPPVQDTQGKYVKSKTKFFSTQPVYKWVGSPADEAKVQDAGLDAGDRTLLGWHHQKIFPFYVLSPDLFGKDYEKIRFVCHNSNCYPYNPNNNYVDEVSVSINQRLRGEKSKPKKLRDCVIECNQLVPNELGGGHPFSMLSLIDSELDKMDEDSPSVDERLSNVSPMVISVLVTVLVISLGVLVYLSLRKK